MNELISKAMKKRWAKIPKEKRSAYASRIAKIKNRKMTNAEKTNHAKMMLDKRYNSPVSA